MKPRLIVVAGPNGSGKTTITEQLLRHTWMQGCAYINPDLIAHQQFGDWNDPIAVKKAADFASKVDMTSCYLNIAKQPRLVFWQNGDQRHIVDIDLFAQLEKQSRL